MSSNKKTIGLGTVATIAALIISTSIFLTRNSGISPESGLSPAKANAAQGKAPSQTSAQPPGGLPSITLDDAQFKSVNVEPAGRRLFTIQQEAVGNIAFNDDKSVQVYPSNQGKIIDLFARLGDKVVKGQKLYTIDSPDLIQAESALIAAAGVYDLTTRVLERARKLYKTQGIAQKDLEQAISDQQSAEGAYRAARDAVSIFGKTGAQIDRIVAKRMIDPVMVVRSPITGRITARNAAPGLLAQPGTPPAPYSVADISTMWMVAYVPESASPLFRVGQAVKAGLMAFQGRVFAGRISAIGETVDPATHRSFPCRRFDRHRQPGAAPPGYGNRGGHAAWPPHAAGSRAAASDAVSTGER